MYTDLQNKCISIKRQKLATKQSYTNVIMQIKIGQIHMKDGSIQLTITSLFELYKTLILFLDIPDLITSLV